MFNVEWIDKSVRCIYRFPPYTGFGPPTNKFFSWKGPNSRAEKDGYSSLGEISDAKMTTIFLLKKKEDNYFTGIMFSMKAIAKLIAISNQSQSQIEKKK